MKWVFSLAFWNSWFKRDCYTHKRVDSSKRCDWKKAEKNSVLSKNVHVYFNIKFTKIKLSVKRCQANPTQNSNKMLNDSFFTLWDSLEENASNFVQLCLYLISNARKLMEKYKYCPPPSIIISERCRIREGVGEMFKLKHNPGRRTKLTVKIFRVGN